jgi:predicted AlkP superfamily pyrophosphatase or phosphodiesterase
MEVSLTNKQSLLSKISYASLWRYFFLLLIVIISMFVCEGCDFGGSIQLIKDLQPTVLLISFDGFRWDYLDKTDAPYLDSLITNGVKAKSLIPVFPSKTFPNHYTIVTGLYTENHGIVANTMYDPEFNATFTLRDRQAVEDGRWWGGEPLWVTTEKQGQISASLFWPGSEAEIKGIRPTYWERFDSSLPYTKRVEKVLSWLDLAVKERPTLITLYFEEPDSQGHANGPNSSQVKDAIHKVDNALGNLLQGLRERGILEDINIIIVSDHGMTDISKEKIIFLDEYVNLSDIDVIDWSPVTGIRPHEGRQEVVYKSLLEAHPHLSVYRKEEIPERFHYRSNSRIAPIIAIADEGWSISSHSQFKPWEVFPSGNHGYDYQLKSMQGIFIAHGPAFKDNLLIDSFQNIHIYNLVTHILGIEPSSNNGNFNSIQTILETQ